VRRQLAASKMPQQNQPPLGLRLGTLASGKLGSKGPRQIESISRTERARQDSLAWPDLHMIFLSPGVPFGGWYTVRYDPVTLQLADG
jgi:hypothetical protein